MILHLSMYIILILFHSFNDLLFLSNCVSTLQKLKITGIKKKLRDFYAFFKPSIALNMQIRSEII